MRLAAGYVCCGQMGQRCLTTFYHYHGVSVCRRITAPHHSFCMSIHCACVTCLQTWVSGWLACGLQLPYRPLLVLGWACERHVSVTCWHSRLLAAHVGRSFQLLRTSRCTSPLQDVSCFWTVTHVELVFSCTRVGFGQLVVSPRRASCLSLVSVQVTRSPVPLCFGRQWQHLSENVRSSCPCPFQCTVFSASICLLSCFSFPSSGHLPPAPIHACTHTFPHAHT